MLRKRLTVMLTSRQRIALEALAREEGESMSVVARRLFCREAQRKGVWPPLGSNGERHEGEYNAEAV